MNKLSNAVLLLSIMVLFIVTAPVSNYLHAQKPKIEERNDVNNLSPATKSLTTIDLVGDLDLSNELVRQIQKDNAIFVALGDLGYESDLSGFQRYDQPLKLANNSLCVLGNHDSTEDGNSNVEKQAIEYCDDHWVLKIANETTLLIGLNTNGDTNLQTSWGQSLVTNSTLMEGVENVILISHKPAHTPPKSHHPVESSTLEMYTGIESKIPTDVEIFQVAGHNHFMAETIDGHWFISGAGGRSHYEGQSDSTWTYFNNKDYGYLQIKIDNNNGKIISAHFYGLDGKLIH